MDPPSPSLWWTGRWKMADGRDRGPDLSPHPNEKGTVLAGRARHLDRTIAPPLHWNGGEGVTFVGRKPRVASGGSAFARDAMADEPPYPGLFSSTPMGSSECRALRVLPKPKSVEEVTVEWHRGGERWPLWKIWMLPRPGTARTPRFGQHALARSHWDPAACKGNCNKVLFSVGTNLWYYFPYHGAEARRLEWPGRNERR